MTDVNLLNGRQLEEIVREKLKWPADKIARSRKIDLRRAVATMTSSKSMKPSPPTDNVVPDVQTECAQKETKDNKTSPLAPLPAQTDAQPKKTQTTNNRCTRHKQTESQPKKTEKVVVEEGENGRSVDNNKLLVTSPEKEEKYHPSPAIIINNNKTTVQPAAVSNGFERSRSSRCSGSSNHCVFQYQSEKVPSFRRTNENQLAALKSFKKEEQDLKLLLHKTRQDLETLGSSTRDQLLIQPLTHFERVVVGRLGEVTKEVSAVCDRLRTKADEIVEVTNILENRLVEFKEVSSTSADHCTETQKQLDELRVHLMKIQKSLENEVVT